MREFMVLQNLFWNKKRDTFIEFKRERAVKCGHVTMMDKVVIDEIKAMLPKEIVFEKEDMKQHTTFRVGGEADLYIRIQNIPQIQGLMPFIIKSHVPYFIIGNGSNLLVSDEGFHGVVIEIGEQFSNVSVEGNCIRALAGTLLGKVSNGALQAGLSGMEFASGIPGTIGGAMVMNAGAYDGEMKQIVKEVKVLTPNGEIIVLNNQEMEFGYRYSILKKELYVVLEVLLALETKQKDEIMTKMYDFSARRREKQPLEFPSAGSTFRRPLGYFAGKLIMDSGLRGFMIGGAQVSEKHCGFIINKDNASAKDIYTLVKEVQKRVKEDSGVMLEPEVIFLGEFK